MEREPEESFDGNEEDFLPARIDNISVSNLGFIVFLKAEGDKRVLPIFIGANEAQSIAIAFNNQTPPRPLTHDLMKNVLGLLDMELTKIQVTSLSENTFYGRIFFKKEGIENLDVDARPSDAIALALRYKAPIFVHRDVYESAAILVKERGEGEGEGEMDAEAEAELAGEAADPVAGASAGVEKSPLTRMERLQERLKKALKAERYEEAARIRDEMKRLESGN
jgi:uncharacterized protein